MNMIRVLDNGLDKGKEEAIRRYAKDDLNSWDIQNPYSHFILNITREEKCSIIKDNLEDNILKSLKILDRINLGLFFSLFKFILRNAFNKLKLPTVSNRLFELSERYVRAGLFHIGDLITVFYENLRKKLNRKFKKLGTDKQLFLVIPRQFGMELSSFFQPNEKFFQGSPECQSLLFSSHGCNMIKICINYIELPLIKTST
ncbi:hypothetical protein BpHYR1_004702 [Brachionus plicatilis]|uniref:Uncharacterized protein n=1 Tax=Brachionus plicatilis TaxID=10195 RepID=A0A3M7T2I5_BRAPC|nr:hypothetical protein BpHYR1_004702 [Brachionus plicatilis]